MNGGVDRNNGFLDALVADVLGRTIDCGTRIDFDQSVAHGASRAGSKADTRARQTPTL
jgi:hypothetical protein